MTAFSQLKQADGTLVDFEPKAAPPAKRPSRWSLSNWPVRWKVFAIVLVPLVLAGTFGGLRIYSSVTDASDLRRAADRAEMVSADCELHGRARERHGGRHRGRRHPSCAHRIRLQQGRIEQATGGHRCRIGRPAGHQHAAGLRPGPGQQGHVQLDRPAHPRHHLRAAAADLRDGDHRIGAQRRTERATRGPKPCRARLAPAARWRCSRCLSIAASTCQSPNCAPR